MTNSLNAKVVVVSHFLVGKKPFTSLISFDGRHFRASTPHKKPEIGQVLDITFTQTSQPPHQDNITLSRQQPRPPIGDLHLFLQQQMTIHTGGIHTLFSGLSAPNDVQARYVSDTKGMPSETTLFWQTDKPLTLRKEGKRVRYQYAGDGTKLPFVGAITADLPQQIEAGTLICLTLAPWWQPKNQPHVEPRCYLQLVSWFQPRPTVAYDGGGGDLWEEEEYDMPPPLWDEPEPMLFPDNSQPVSINTAVWKPIATGSPLDTLKSVFGYDQFRQMQEDVVQQVLAKKDGLAIMPTGRGKSLCYQLPALHFDGLTIVVSPLIALMIDQVQQLHEIGVSAASLNSSMPLAEQQQVTSNLLHGRTKLLYISPESLLRPRTLQLLSQCKVSCFTIDEAHCISAWGHDFRKEYRELRQVRQRFPDAVCLALTATATNRVREDILHTMGIPAANQFIASFDRPNLHLSIEEQRSGWGQIDRFLARFRGQSGIIYCTTRKQVDALTEQLSDQGLPVLPYHAGLDDQTRKLNQRRFIYEEEVIMVATVAFGMGINKPNVRFVLHFGLPKNIEGYYQQIGRAGRDGLPAHCLLLYSYGDISTINYFIGQMEKESEKQGAKQRLDALLRYAETNDCRRRPLLDYFAEDYGAECGDMCDNCQDGSELIDLTAIAQTFLTCVQQTGERFGQNHIIDVLRGSRAERVMTRRHHTLSSYGRGRGYSKKEWQSLGRQLLSGNLLEKEPEYGGLQLTEQGEAVLNDSAQFKGKAIKAVQLSGSNTAVSSTPTPSNYDTKLFEQLRQLRSKLAREADIPPYAVFSDRTLVDMALKFPQSKASFAHLYGVGQAKLQKYADHFLPIIQAYCTENNIAEVKSRGSVGARPLPQPGKGLSRQEEVWQTYQDGSSVQEIAQKYGVKAHTVLNHLWKAVQAGRPLRHDEKLLELSGLDIDVQQDVLDAFREHGTDFLRPIYDQLGESVSYSELHIFRLHVTSQE